MKPGCVFPQSNYHVNEKRNMKKTQIHIWQYVLHIKHMIVIILSLIILVFPPKLTTKSKTLSTLFVCCARSIALKIKLIRKSKLMDALNCNWLENTKEGNSIKELWKMYTALARKSEVKRGWVSEWVWQKVSEKPQ